MNTTINSTISINKYASHAVYNLDQIEIKPISPTVAKTLVVQHHYQHSYPGGTKLSFGVFLGSQLKGAITLGIGSYLAHSLVDQATLDDCLTLTRMWLSDSLPHNSESKALSLVLRSLRRYTGMKFIITYADPLIGHVGTVYQATGWLYTGLSSATPLYDIGDGISRHSRTLAHSLGSHSIRYLSQHGLYVKLVPQLPKHRYIKFLDVKWQYRLLVPVLPYPKKEWIISNESN